MIHRTPPGGFGRAIRACLDHFTGDVVVLVMADLSDEPRDIVTYYRLIEDGNDAVFGSRFMPGSVVSDYPRVKLLANRMGNTLIRMLFRTHHNDLTNAFKAYRAEVVRALMPLYGSHFNVLIELSLGALIRNYRIATCPINWYGRKWGRANFRIRELGRRYFATLIRAYAERIFILDDVLAEHAKTVRWLREPASMVESVEANIGHEKDSSHGRGGFRWKQSSVSA
jgi:dolichol-phosphate mannosyltransferase